MPKRRRYNHSDIAQALVYAETAPSIKAAAQDLDIPDRTLHNWANGLTQSMPSSADMATAKRQLSERMRYLATISMERLIERTLKGTPSDNALNAIMGTSFDKWRLLNGESTANTTTTHITEEQAKQETAQLLSEAIAIYASMTDEQRATLLREQSAPVDVIEGCDKKPTGRSEMEVDTEEDTKPTGRSENVERAGG